MITKTIMEEIDVLWDNSLEYFYIDLDGFLQYFFDEDHSFELDDDITNPLSNKFHLLIEERKGELILSDMSENYSSLLSKPIRYTIFTLEKRVYLAISRHLGGDYRVNYGDIEIYTLKDKFDSFPSFYRASLSCSKCKEIYDLDENGYLHPPLDGVTYRCCGELLDVYEICSFPIEK